MANSVAKGDPWKGARTIEATQARQSFRDIMDEAYAAGRRVVIMRHKRPIAALVAITDFVRLCEIDKGADARMLERATQEQEQSESVPIEGLISSFEHHEAGNVQEVEGEVRFGEVPAEQLVSEVLAQYLESPQFLNQARRHVGELIDAASSDRTSFPAAEASALKQEILAYLVAHGLMTHSYA